MKNRVHYTIVKSRNIGDLSDEATYEIRPHKNGGYFISAIPTRGDRGGPSILVGNANELRFETVELAKRWLEAQPDFGVQTWSIKDENV